MSTLSVQRFSGSDLHAYIDDIARLRIEVFRDFPYLYDGDMEYERQYLQTYVQCESAVVVVAFDGSQVVGASTGIPLQFEEDSFKSPFAAHEFNPEKIFYCAESVLKSRFRKKRIGVRFFEEREAHAKQLGGFEYASFCAVDRPADHPLRPDTYQSLDQFWKNRGYRQYPQIQTEYRWKDVDQDEETSKAMVFWLKSLNSAV